MYNLHLSAEQLEFRDTVRDFVTRQVKPVVLKADRLDASDRRLPMALLDQASQLGLRTLTLAEDHGGEITLADRGDEGHGAVVTLIFPLKQKPTRDSSVQKKGIGDEQERIVDRA